MESWHWMRPFMEGGIASAIAEMTTFPLDLTKTRLQIQVSVKWIPISCILYVYQAQVDYINLTGSRD